VHVSGHASQEEMKLMLNLVKPQYFIPIHGELHQLHQHANIAKKLGFPADQIAIIENGQVIEFQNRKMSLGERIPGGYIFVDGALVGDIGPAVVREREALARDGLVLVNLTVDRNTLHLCEEPEIISRGFFYPRNGDDLTGSITRLAKEVAQNANGNLEEDLEQTIKSFIFNKTRRRPMVFVTLSRA
jgi:ribonuclease J